jgi:hypothetical protein
METKTPLTFSELAALCEEQKLEVEKLRDSYRRLLDFTVALAELREKERSLKVGD